MPESKWFAAFWEWQLRSENKKTRGIREEIAGAASGRVLEVGCGPGSNFSYYDVDVASLAAIDPNPHMLERARKRADQLTREIALRLATVEQLPLDDDSFDT